VPHAGQLYEPQATTPGTPDQSLQPIVFNKSAPPSSWPDTNLSDYAQASAWFGAQLWPRDGIGDPRTVYDRLRRPHDRALDSELPVRCELQQGNLYHA